MARFHKDIARKRGIVTVRPAPGHSQRAIVQCGPLTFRAAIGRSGRSAFKREGDGATPIADMRLLYGFVRGDRLKAVETPLKLLPIHPSMHWCDAPGDPRYNRLVRGPLKVSHEEMARTDGLYDICLVLDWNITSRARNRGSAIFFHLIKPGYEPTAGCIAISLTDMRRLLKVMRAGTVVRVL